MLSLHAAFLLVCRDTGFVVSQVNAPCLSLLDTSSGERTDPSLYKTPQLFAAFLCLAKQISLSAVLNCTPMVQKQSCDGCDLLGEAMGGERNWMRNRCSGKLGTGFMHDSSRKGFAEGVDVSSLSKGDGILQFCIWMTASESSQAEKKKHWTAKI